MSRTAALLLIASGFLGACSNSTQYVASWKDPGTPSFHLNRTLAVFMTTDAGMRRMVEDRLASRLPGEVPSYRLIPDNEVQQIDSVHSHIAAGGFDGIVVMRLVGESTQVTGVSHDFYGYWGYWSSAYDPVYYTTSKFYSMESTLYSTKNEKMVWMGRSETVDPKNANKLADFSVNFVVKHLQKDGYIP
jgi:hypothetical protein